MELKDQIALVTGAGRGIGHAIAIALAKAGAHVAVNDLNAETAQRTADEVRAAGRHAIALPGDVTDDKVVDALVHVTVEKFGRLDIAVANAYYSDRSYFWE